jgi:uncharacterized OsmC-like protein
MPFVNVEAKNRAAPATRRGRRSERVVARRQAPLRARYADSPAAARTRKSARTSSARVAAGDPFHGEVEVGHGYDVALRFGLDRHVGGLHDAPNPGDLLCAALAACQDGTIRMIADMLAIELDELEVEVTGELDVRGCLGLDPDVRVGFETLECAVRLVAAPGADPKRIEALLVAAERFCVNLDTLRGPTDVATRATVACANMSPPDTLPDGDMSERPEPHRTDRPRRDGGQPRA